MTERKLPEKLQEVLEKRTAEGSFLLAVDGPCGSGKTTLAERIAEEFPCSVFHMDDFFLRNSQRTPHRLKTPGGHVDWERFLEEVLLPLKEKKAVTFRPYSCKTQKLEEAVTVSFRPFTLVEGVYSMHPQLEKYYDFSVFVTVRPEIQSQRILLRNGEKMHQRFVNEFIPLENLYFEKTQTQRRCSMTVEGYF